MKPKVYIASTKKNTENDLIDAVTVCFNQFGGVENFVKGNIFIKINATAVNRDSITSPEVIYAIIKVIQEVNVNNHHIYIFDNCFYFRRSRHIFVLLWS